MRWFKKKDLIAEAKRDNKKADMKLAIESAKMVREFFNELTQGCTSETEQLERLKMAKENNPEFFKKNQADIVKHLKLSRLEGVEKMIEIAKKVDEKTMKSLQNMKELGKADKQLEYKE